MNVGSFTGKSLAYPLRIELGVESINFFAALMTFLALVVVFFFYRNVDIHGEGKSFGDAWRGLTRLVSNPRLMTLILIVTGFWIIQHQMYATMPKYVLRTVGPHASPEWIANVNPFVVMICVVFITGLMKNVLAITSINIGMILMPLSALCMASSPLLERFAGPSVPIFGLVSAHPITVMLIAGIVVQGLAECFISPRYLEFFSLQAPKGEEGAYLGLSHLHSFLALLLGFGLSGYLLTASVPTPPRFLRKCWHTHTTTRTTSGTTSSASDRSLRSPSPSMPALTRRLDARTRARPLSLRLPAKTRIFLPSLQQPPIPCVA